jgi:predicted ArsR family transcriptional regulator
VTPSQRRMLLHMKGDSTCEEIADRAKVNPATARTCMKYLVDAGLAEVVGKREKSVKWGKSPYLYRRVI